MILLNGNPLQSIDITDRGLQYGDGVFETIAIRDGYAILLEMHLYRLQSACNRLKIPCPNLAVLREEIAQVLTNQVDAVLKVIITRGQGGRGYKPPEQVTPSRIISLHPLQSYPNTHKTIGIDACFCQTRLGISPDLAGIKHLNRLEQVLARAEWPDSNVSEGLMSDHIGHVIEGTMSNLFFVKDKILYTSPIIDSGISGVMRNLIIGIALSTGLPIQLTHFSQDQLILADEIFLTNSVIGIWPIKNISGRQFLVGKITQQIMDHLERCE